MVLLGVISLTFAAPVAPVKLNGPLVSGGSAGGVFQISPASDRVVYLADQEVNGRQELYSVPVSNPSAAVKLSVGNVWGVMPRISPNGNDVVYWADPYGQNVDDVFSCPIDGSAAPVRLSDGMFGAQNDFEISPDSNYVVYRRGSYPHTLISIPITGGARVEIGGRNLSYRKVESFAISPDSSRAIYISDKDVDGVDELFACQIHTSSTSVQLSAPLVSGGDVKHMGFAGDGRVVYLADQETDSKDELYT